MNERTLFMMIEAGVGALYSLSPTRLDSKVIESVVVTGASWQGHSKMVTFHASVVLGLKCVTVNALQEMFPRQTLGYLISSCQMIRFRHRLTFS